MRLKIGENLTAEGDTEEIAILVHKLQQEITVKADLRLNEDYICATMQNGVVFVTSNSILALKEFRIAKGLTQKALAQLLNVSEPTISLYESGMRKPDIVTLKKLAKILNCTTDQLLEPIEI